uniref:Uncharacterized protein n=1 Tax=Oryza nivara TaxID=4536 RepID=A0A0E0HQC9_ORYNI
MGPHVSDTVEGIKEGLLCGIHLGTRGVRRVPFVTSFLPAYLFFSSPPDYSFSQSSPHLSPSRSAFSPRAPAPRAGCGWCATARQWLHGGAEPRRRRCSAMAGRRPSEAMLGCGGAETGGGIPSGWELVVAAMVDWRWPARRRRRASGRRSWSVEKPEGGGCRGWQPASREEEAAARELRGAALARGRSGCVRRRPRSAAREGREGAEAVMAMEKAKVGVDRGGFPSQGKR